MSGICQVSQFEDVYSKHPGFCCKKALLALSQTVSAPLSWNRASSKRIIFQGLDFIQKVALAHSFVARFSVRIAGTATCE